MAKDSLKKTSSSEEVQAETNEMSQEEAGKAQQSKIDIVNISAPLPSSEPAIEVVDEQDSTHSEQGGLVRSAALNMLGNLGSSVMGMVRQVVLATTGAATAGPFFFASKIPQTFNDFIVNGSVSGALIPTFNDYAAPEKHQELRRIVYSVVNLVLLVMVFSALGFFFIAPWFVGIVATGLKPEERELTTQLARIMFLMPLMLGPFAVLQAVLYARKEFRLTAFATAAAHVGIIIGALALGWNVTYRPYGLALGALLGAAGEIALLLPGLRKEGLNYMLVLDLKHPAFKQIIKLYGPVSISFFASSILVFFDQHLSSLTPCADFMRNLQSCGTNNYSAMQFATTLIQFPGGLVAAALSFAVLPTLTANIREGQIERFKSTLALGFRLGLLLMIPAAAGLVVLQWPIALLLFRHGGSTPEDARLVAVALQNYSYQLPFVAIDQLLIAAFYARKNTIIPVAVLFVSILSYLAVALPFSSTLGMPALALANTAQNATHAIVLLLILRKVIGSIHVRTMLPAVGKILLATAVMVALAWGLQLGLAYVPLFSLDKIYGQALTVVLVGGVCAVSYFSLITLFKVEEVRLLKGAVMAKLGKK